MNMEGSFATGGVRRGRGCPTAHPVAQMRLLPHETVRVAGQSLTGTGLHVRVRSEDLPVLQKVATGGWLQHVVPEVTVLASTRSVEERMQLNPYETCTLTVPLPLTGRADGEPTKKRRRGEEASAALSLPISAVRMLPGKGSSLARRAIVTLRLDR